MNFVLIILGVCTIAFFGLLSIPSPKEVKSRDVFLEGLRKFMEGRMEAIPDSEDGYEIFFQWQQRDFIYQDVYTPGFKTRVNKAYLKLHTVSSLTLTLSEKKNERVIRSDTSVFPNGKIRDNSALQSMDIPDSLKEFSVHVNKNAKAKELFSDPKIARIFADFKNMDSRGYPICSLRIVDGTIILEFQPNARFRPSLDVLYADVAMIEDYANKLIFLANRIELD